MGNFKCKGLQVDNFRLVNLQQMWSKYSQRDQIDQSSFVFLITFLSNALGCTVEQQEIGSLFNYLQKGGCVNFSRFEAEYEKWSNAQAQEIYGTEVIRPVLSLGHVTKNYDLIVPYDTFVFKRISFKNPHDYIKHLNVASSNENILVIRTPKIRIQPGESVYIKFKIKALCDTEVFIIIQHSNTNMHEETLSMNIKTEEKPKTPSRPSSGSLNKNKNWSFTGKRPSPRRNSEVDEVKY